ncbi:hypothetical protein BY458DRAFT_44542 [Sporodiniella umbellata]|nr:hypothetical protein BY458DRAFT_44542 [Sporodiniella umbellata]
MGLTMAASLGPSAALLDPEITRKALSWFCALSVVLILLIVWIVCICQKVDGRLDWSWSVICVPLYGVNLLEVWIRWLSFCRPKEEEEDEMLLNQGKYKVRASIGRCLSLLELCFFLVFEGLVIAHLDKVSIHSAWIAVAYMSRTTVYLIRTGGRFWLLQTLVCLQLICLLYIPSWANAFSPTYLLGWVCWNHWLTYARQAAGVPNPEMARFVKSITSVVSIILFVFLVLFYVVLGLIVAKLGGTLTVRLSIVLIPLFVVIGVMLCCSGCLLPCVVIGSSLNDFEQDVIDPSRRITTPEDALANA